MNIIVKNTKVIERKLLTSKRKSSFTRGTVTKTGVVRSAYTGLRPDADKTPSGKRSLLSAGLDKLGTYASSLAGKIAGKTKTEPSGHIEIGFDKPKDDFKLRQKQDQQEIATKTPEKQIQEPQKQRSILTNNRENNNPTITNKKTKQEIQLDNDAKKRETITDTDTPTNKPTSNVLIRKNDGSIGFDEMGMLREDGLLRDMADNLVDPDNPMKNISVDKIYENRETARENLKMSLFSLAKERGLNLPQLEKMMTNAYFHGEGDGTNNSKPINDSIERHINAWSVSSGDTQMTPIIRQLAIRDEFGISDADTSHFELSKNSDDKSKFRNLVISQATSHYKSNADAFRLITRAEYNATQEYLKHRGISELTVFRGMNGDRVPAIKGTQNGQSRIVNVGTQPATSYTLSPEIANNFAKSRKTPATLMTKLPASKVFSIPLSGSGCSDEFEIIALGGKTNAIVRNGIITNIPQKRDNKSPEKLVIIANAGRIDRKARQQGALSMIKGLPPNDYKNYLSGAKRVKETFTGIDFYIDRDLIDADWSKTTWNLPPYKSKEFFKVFYEKDLPSFRELPVYINAVKTGRIKDDSWVK